ncbi:MAG TPA: VOC family protein [Acidimicrobiia bacterium]|nr:VOC family protein [Acidimicrobiia bacterium]
MRVERLLLRVSDLDASITFWTEKVGLELVGRGGPFAFIDGGGVQVALNQMDERPDDASLTEIVLGADDVRTAYDELAARGVPFEVELRPVTSDGNHELWAAHFRDPDGHLASVTGWI